ncbi:hypothetical protein L3Y34_003482 [Caenorhabditis briggsae]|uniref:DOMON domain-containing protein n=1 Tax=Caenorhabditis briggsae TaxID=6238 RepID=A0AAE9ADE0_CAEBR|nr:hypothetical protein L3Y34_003482 [Caenorhabditis briggsae]
MIVPISLLFLFLSFVPFSYSATCDFENEVASMSWMVKGDVLQINFEHKNLTENRWASIAFGNGPGMINLESIIFSRDDNNVITTNTGFTPKKKKVVVDDVSYVTVRNVQLKGDLLRITVTRPLGPAGPRDFSLDQCVNWIVVPGGALSNGKFKKHHGQIYFVKDVCAAKCTAQRMMRVLSNRIH